MLKLSSSKVKFKVCLMGLTLRIGSIVLNDNGMEEVVDVVTLGSL